MSGGISDLIQMGSNSTLRGLTLNLSDGSGPGGFTRGVVVVGVSGATISGNTIKSQAPGGNSVAGIALDNATNIVIRDNTIVAQGNGATGASAVFAFPTGGTSVSFTLSGNSLGGSGAAFNDYLRASNASGPVTILPGSTGNTILSGGCAAVVDAGAASFTNGSPCP
jgi:hypothetical protein